MAPSVVLVIFGFSFCKVCAVSDTDGCKHWLKARIATDNALLQSHSFSRARAGAEKTFDRMLNLESLANDQWKLQVMSGSASRRSEMVAQQVRARVAADGQLAFVQFEHGGMTQRYELESFSVYSAGAQVVQHTDEGESRLKVQARTFRSRVPGQWAAARLHTNGSVSGLFEHQGQLLQIRPSDQHSDGSSIHTLQYQGVDFDTSRHVVNPLAMLESASTRLNGSRSQWGGDKWFPGCYDGDSEPHEIIIGFVADVLAWQQRGEALVSDLETALLEASVVWQNQMNIVLKLGYLKVYKSEVGAPAFATRVCDVEGESIYRRLADFMTDAPNMPYQAGIYLFTGCMHKTTGMAWVGLPSNPSICSACSSSHQCKNTGVVTLVQNRYLWYLFAHEFGHNFAALHSFQEGQGSTGGIMDYNWNGLHDGVRQYNTQYQKSNMCGALSTRVNKCQNKFQAIGSSPSPAVPTPSPTSAPPTVAPTPAPPTPASAGCATCMSGGAAPAGYCLYPDGTCYPMTPEMCISHGHMCEGGTPSLPPVANPTPTPTPLPPTLPPTPAPTSASSSSGCSGDPCTVAAQCRSQWGYCGESDAHCNEKSIWKASGCAGSEDTPQPTAQPTLVPTLGPTRTPTLTPTFLQTVEPTPAPTAAPTRMPTLAPTFLQTVEPTPAPTAAPTRTPTIAPTLSPTAAPTPAPTVPITPRPTAAPTPLMTVSPAPVSTTTVEPTTTTPAQNSQSYARTEWWPGCSCSVVSWNTDYKSKDSCESALC